MSHEVAADAQDHSTPPTKSPPSWLLPVRIVLFAVLGVAIIGLVVDQLARRAASEAFAKLNQQLGPDAEMKDITAEQVHQLIGRSPVDDSDPEDHFETFVWQGALRPQKLFVQYQAGGQKLLKDVSLNEPPAGFVE